MKKRYCIWRFLNFCCYARALWPRGRMRGGNCFLYGYEGLFLIGRLKSFECTWFDSRSIFFKHKCSSLFRASSFYQSFSVKKQTRLLCLPVAANFNIPKFLNHIFTIASRWGILFFPFLPSFLPFFEISDVPKISESLPFVVAAAAVVFYFSVVFTLLLFGALFIRKYGISSSFASRCVVFPSFFFFDQRSFGVCFSMHPRLSNCIRTVGVLLERISPKCLLFYIK